MAKVPTHTKVVAVKLTEEQMSQVEAACDRLVRRPGTWAREVLVAAAAQVLKRKNGKR